MSRPDLVGHYRVSPRSFRMGRPMVAQIVVHHLEQMNSRYPELDEQSGQAAAEAVALLEAEG